VRRIILRDVYRRTRVLVGLRVLVAGNGTSGTAKETVEIGSLLVTTTLQSKYVSFQHKIRIKIFEKFCPYKYAAKTRGVLNNWGQMQREEKNEPDSRCGTERNGP
jgi:hypothetical protein